MSSVTSSKEEIFHINDVTFKFPNEEACRGSPPRLCEMYRAPGKLNVCCHGYLEVRWLFSFFQMPYFGTNLTLDGLKRTKSIEEQRFYGSIKKRPGSEKN